MRERTSESSGGGILVRPALKERAIEATAGLAVTVAFLSLLVPVWLVLTYRPDRAHPVDRILQACQLGAQRGPLGWAGLAAGLVVTLWGGWVIGRFAIRAASDLVAMRRLRAELQGATACTRPLAGGVQPVSIVAERVAFTAGLLRPRVYLGAGLLVDLQPEEVEAVLLHERHHARRYDPLRCWLVGLALSSLGLHATRSLARWYKASREADADRAAVSYQADDRPLLRALLKADSVTPSIGVCGLTAGRQAALRDIRCASASASTADWVVTGLGLAAVGATFALALAGLTDWQWYRFCPYAGAMAG